MRRQASPTLLLTLLLTLAFWSGCVQGGVELSGPPETTNNQSTPPNSGMQIEFQDADGDGYDESQDCDDSKPAINPGVVETCGDLIDNNCAGGVDEGCGPSINSITPVPTPGQDMGNPMPGDDMGTIVVAPDMGMPPQPGEDMGTPPATDADNDGFSPPQDCDDNNAQVSPAAPEICGDNIDNNCAGGVDEGCSPVNSRGVGASCSTGMDCDGGVCVTGWPSGYCSAQCSQSVACPGGSTCYQLNSSQGPVLVCLDDCASSADCRPGYACVVTQGRGACGPACSSDAECAQGYVCDSSTGQCTQSSTPTNNTSGNNNPGTNGSASQATANGTLTNEQITSGGLSRNYLVYVPSNYNPATPMPLVLAYHGNGDSAQNFYNALQLGSWAQGSGFILATLDGPIRNIQGYQLAWDAYSAPAQNADLTFSRDVINALKSQYAIDNSRIYALGHSQGGFFSFYLGMVEANTISAIAMQASAAPQGGALIQSAARRTPVYLAIGTQDSLLNAARSTRDQLNQAGHDVLFEEMPGVGHGGWQSSKTNTALSFILGY